MPEETELRAALRAHFGSVPLMGEAEWTLLHDRIVAAARARLPGMTAPSPWWLYASRWARHAVPAGLAAGILVALGLSILEGNVDPGSVASPDGPVVVEEVIATAASEVLATDPLLSADEPAFLSVVLGGQE
ncbi:MAG: hypothetical protein ACREMX_17575 [Gemmatimonadales bacterium]